MNKTETAMLKGVAILMMVFYHLFYRPDNAALCADVALWNDQTLLLWLANACNPVAFFVLLGGYGMYIVTQKGDKHRYSRILKLYTHLWCIMGIFLLVGHFMQPDKYPGSWTSLLSNLTGYEASYNNEYWFLLPYVALTLTCPWLFRLTRKMKAWWVVLLSALLTIAASFIISRYKDAYLIQHNWLLQIVRYFNFMLAFMLGAMSAREGWIQSLRQRFRLSWMAWLMLVLLFAGRCFVHTSLVNAPFAFLFIVLLLIAPRPQWLDRLFAHFGGISMDIWFIHSWLCFYLFHDWVYSLHNPLLILFAVFGISYVMAFLVNKVLTFVLSPLSK